MPDDDLARFVVAAAGRVSMCALQGGDRNSGKPQYHPRMMLALVVSGHGNGLFSSRRIERAELPKVPAATERTHRRLGMRFVIASTRPDHDTIASSGR